MKKIVFHFDIAQVVEALEAYLLNELSINVEGYETEVNITGDVILTANAPEEAEQPHL